MAHGTPDWGITAAKRTIYSLHDMGELAVRLGSMVSFDRRGDVIFMDRFDDGENRVTVLGGGADNEIYPTCGNPLIGPLHLNFYTGDVTGDHSGFVMVVPQPVDGGIGVECSFIPVANLAYFRIGVMHFDGENVRRYRAEYRHPTGTLYVYGPEDEWHLLGTPGVLREGYTLYSTLKLVFDTNDKAYERVILNDVSYLATHRPASVQADLVTRPSVAVEVTVETAIDDHITVAVDRFIITQNEPVT